MSYNDAVRFTQFLFGMQSGFAEIYYAVCDPQNGLTLGGWYEWPSKKEKLLQDALVLAEQYGDVYIGSTLYTRKKRSATYALPSQVVLLDDAPDRVDYSVVVKTSEHSQHAYFLLDQCIDPIQRAQLQKRIAYALGADHCHDATRLVRLPVGANTKEGGWQPVRLEQLTNRTYSVAELEAMFPLVTRQNDLVYSDLCPEKISYWQTNLALLLDIEDIPKRFSPRSQGRKLLNGQMPYPETGNGKRDTSMGRAILARSLILHGYPDEEARTLLAHIAKEGSERKGQKWLNDDCQRLIAKYRAEETHIIPRSTTTYQTRLDALTKLLRQHWEDDVTGKIAYYAHDLAETIGIGKRAIQFYLAQLEAAGKIRRSQEAGPGGRGIITLTIDFWNDCNKNYTAPQAHSVSADLAASVDSPPETGVTTSEKIQTVILPESLALVITNDIAEELTRCTHLTELEAADKTKPSQATEPDDHGFMTLTSGLWGDPYKKHTAPQARTSFADLADSVGSLPERVAITAEKIRRLDLPQSPNLRVWRVIVVHATLLLTRYVERARRLHLSG